MRSILYLTLGSLLAFGFLASTYAFPCGDNYSANSGTATVSPELMLAVELYNEGWGGSDEALVEAMNLLDQLISSHGPTPLLRAYYGSACIARARMIPDRQKARWLRRGAAELDAAARAAPADVQVRLLRATSFSILPRITGRMETVENDFAWLVGRAGEEGELAAACRQAIYYHAGAFALRNRHPQALALLEEAAEISSGEIIGQEQVVRMLELAREQLHADAGSRHD